MSLLRPFLLAAAFAAAVAANALPARRAPGSAAAGSSSGVPASQAGSAARSADAGTTPCDLAAYVVDPDPQGLNVRSGPGKAFPVVGTIPHGRGSAVGVTVTGSAGQWVRIKDAATQEDGRSVFGGEGWVYAQMLATATRNHTGRDPGAAVVKIYKAPSAKSAVVTRLPDETEVRLAGCKGGWAQVKAGRATGWLGPDSQCANTLTTCS